MAIDIDNITDINLLRLELKRFYFKCKKDWFGDECLWMTRGLYYRIEQVTSDELFVIDGDNDSCGYISGEEFKEYFEEE